MASKSYVVASQEGAVYAGVEEVGAEVELEISEDEELALVAAGWLEPATKQKKEAK
jgi:hypothetical protein